MSKPEHPLAPLARRIAEATGADEMHDLLVDTRRAVLPEPPLGFTDRFFAYLNARAWTDAALALVEAKLPDRRWCVGHVDEDATMYLATVDGSARYCAGSPYTPPEYFREPIPGTPSPTPALAILSALMAALMETPDD